MLITAIYCKTEGWESIKNLLAYLLLSIAAIYLFGFLIIMGIIAGTIIFTGQFLYKSCSILYSSKTIRSHAQGFTGLH